MSINKNKLIKLNDLVTLSFDRKHIIVLNPEEYKNKEDLNGNIIYDTAEWKMPKDINILVNELSKNKYLSNEDKIFSIFEKLCKDYVYDDNILSYMKKIDDNLYILPDWYGKDISQEWQKNREKHNRRVCYELSRYLAKALIELFKDNPDFNICILWYKGLLHYFVGLTCSKYSITLDLEDFYSNIKDLTRLKTGLTAEGIVILDDNEGEFKSALEKFNKGRIKYSMKKIESEINTFISNPDLNQIVESDIIVFFRNAIEILKEKFNIDPQGLFEYMKEIVDIKLGPTSREKVWKIIKGNNNETIRYIRCLVLYVDNQKYIIDVDKMLLRPFNDDEFTKENAEFIPYKELSRDWDEQYDGK